MGQTKYVHATLIKHPSLSFYVNNCRSHIDWCCSKEFVQRDNHFIEMILVKALILLKRIYNRMNSTRSKKTLATILAKIYLIKFLLKHLTYILKEYCRVFKLMQYKDVLFLLFLYFWCLFGSRNVEKRICPLSWFTTD